MTLKENKYKIININLTSIDSSDPISDVPCGTCTKCCEVLTPFLTPEEVSSGLYPLSLIQPDKKMLLENPNVGPLVAMFKKSHVQSMIFDQNLADNLIAVNTIIQ